MRFTCRNKDSESLTALYPEVHPIGPKSILKFIEAAFEFMCTCEVSLLLNRTLLIFQFQSAGWKFNAILTVSSTLKLSVAWNLLYVCCFMN